MVQPKNVATSKDTMVRLCDNDRLLLREVRDALQAEVPVLEDILREVKQVQNLCFWVQSGQALLAAGVAKALGIPLEQLTASNQNAELPPKANEQEVEEELPTKPSQEDKLPAIEALDETSTSTEQDTVTTLRHGEQLEPRCTQHDDLTPAGPKDAAVAARSQQGAELTGTATKEQCEPLEASLLQEAPRHTVLEETHVTADRAQLTANLQSTFSQLGCKRPPEELYDDLSNVSSICGDESPPHKRLKQYVAAKKAMAKSLRAEDASEGKQLLEPTMPDKEGNLMGEHMQLVPCARHEADSATSIRQKIRQKFGQNAAASVLAHYQEKVLRDPHGKSQRYLVDTTGATMRLA